MAAKKKAALAESPTGAALSALARRSQTMVELERALKRKGLDEAARAEALARVKELGYIDDAQVSRGQAQREVAKGLAPRLIARKLEARGVDSQVARSAADEAAGGASEAELAAAALDRLLRGRIPVDERERRRLVARLVRMGHAPRAVFAALKAVGARVDEDADEVPDDGA